MPWVRLDDRIVWEALDLELRGVRAIEIGQSDPTHPYALYRFFDEAARLLYVGISKNSVWTRIVVHRKRDWWSRVTRLEVTYGYSREEALDCELASIQGEEPLFNVQGYPGDGMRYASFEERVAARRAGVTVEAVA